MNICERAIDPGAKERIAFLWTLILEVKSTFNHQNIFSQVKGPETIFPANMKK